MPELMSLCPCPQEQSYQASVPQNFPLNSWERQPAVERSLFEPAEHRPARRETDSESSRRLPEPGFQVAQLGSPVAMTQRREAMSKCFEGLESLADLPLVKSPAHQPEPQFALAFGCHEPTCRVREDDGRNCRCQQQQDTNHRRGSHQPTRPSLSRRRNACPKRDTVAIG